MYRLITAILSFDLSNATIYLSTQIHSVYSAYESISYSRYETHFKRDRMPINFTDA